MKNPTKTWLFLAFLSLFFLILGYQLGERQGMLLGFMLDLTILFLVFFYGDVRTLELFKGSEIEGRDPWGLRDLATRLARAARIPPPRLYVIPMPLPTAFAVGRSWKKGGIVVSEGLLHRLSIHELEAVLAFEIAQIKKMDTLSFGVGTTLAVGILAPADACDHALSALFRTHVHFFKGLIAPLAAGVIRLSVSRMSYFDADRAASELIKDNERIAAVLWKLGSYACQLPEIVPASVAHLFIVNPLTSKAWNRYFHIQPPVSARIERLTGRYPL